MRRLKTFQYSLDPTFSHEGLLFGLLSTSEKHEFGKERRVLTDTYQYNVLDQAKRGQSADWVLRILASANVKSLEMQLLEEQKLKEGQLVWIENSIIFRGITSYKRAPDGGYKSAPGYFHTKLENFGDIEIIGTFDIAHVVSDSAFLRLSGKIRCFMFGYIAAAETQKIEIRPIFIGKRIFNTTLPLITLDTDELYIPPEEIDDFFRIRTVSKRGVRLADAQYISEAQIKTWIAEIIAEDHVPKDWGGEKSDLWSNHVYIDGDRKRAAFLLKGPAKFHPMTIKDLGKGGDQIHRLYSEDADIFILQHCHKVTPVIYQMMRVYSSQFNKISRFCILDGIDTLRLFKAYGKI